MITKTTTLDLYIKGEKVFTYVRGVDSFNESDVFTKVYNMD